MELLKNFLQWSAVTSEPPKAYGAFHIGFLLIGLPLAFLLAYLFRNASEKQNKIIFLSVGAYLLITETYKQLFYTFVISNGVYPLWIFPFQLCSVPMYLCFVIPFLKDGKVKNACYTFLMSFNLFGGFVSFMEPSGLISEYVTLTGQSFMWHIVLVFLGLYIGISRKAGRTMREFKFAVYTFVVFCFIAFCINQVLWKPANGDINMFFIGPAISPLVVFKTIAEKFGWFINSIIYIVCVSLGSFLFYLPFYFYNKKPNRHHTIMASQEAKATETL